ncbi:MAG: IreB family regulatory phosphoprotein [Firmicutes bacterium]|nr:IreB family regulatory phosphoprotein [Bacillota bacterium]
MDTKNTRYFKVVSDEQESVREVLSDVYRALQQKGYNPVNQIIGYIMSDDPTYITNFANARSRISHFTRDEILEELIRTFINVQKLDR